MQHKRSKTNRCFNQKSGSKLKIEMQVIQRWLTIHLLKVVLWRGKGLQYYQCLELFFAVGKSCFVM